MAADITVTTEKEKWAFLLHKNLIYKKVYKSFINLKKVLFIFILFEKQEGGRWEGGRRERSSENISGTGSLSNFLNISYKWGWARLMPGTRSPIQIPHKGDRPAPPAAPDEVH